MEINGGYCKSSKKKIRKLNGRGFLMKRMHPSLCLFVGLIIIILAPMTTFAEADLRVAIQEDDLVTLQNLIAAGADVNNRDGSGTTPLMFAVKHSANPEVIRILSKAGADINTRNVIGRTALIIAAEYNDNPDVISILTSVGADVNAQNDNGWTPLVYATWFNDNLEVIKALINAGADVNAIGEFGTTPLVLAVTFRETDVLEILLESGVDVNTKDSFGLTPLMFAAAKSEDPGVIRVLLNAGANGKIVCNDDKTAFDYARENPAIRNSDAYWLLNDARF